MIRVFVRSHNGAGNVEAFCVEYPTAMHFDTDSGELGIAKDMASAADGRMLAIYAPECWECVELVDPPKAVN